MLNSFLFQIIFKSIFYILVYSLISYWLALPALPSVFHIVTFLDYKFTLDLLNGISILLSSWIIVFLFSSFLGVFLGVIIGNNYVLYKFFSYDIDFFRSIPSVLLLIFVFAIIGDNFISRTFPVAYATFFTVIFYIVKATVNINKNRLNHLKDLGANHLELLQVLFLELLSPIFIALRQAASLSFLVLISIEIIVGPIVENGIGALLNDWSEYLHYDEIIVTTLIIGIIGYLINLIIYNLHKSIVKWEKVE